jgi:hypothetical protein
MSNSYSNWTENYSESGERYFVNNFTGETSWSIPIKNTADGGAASSNVSTSIPFENANGADKNNFPIICEPGWDEFVRKIVIIFKHFMLCEKGSKQVCFFYSLSTCRRITTRLCFQMFKYLAG